MTFDSIGLTLSGGGYRAAAFHLGTLSYLHHINVLQNVRVLSTVSGGTLVGAKYALSLKQSRSFEEFFKEFYTFLRETNLIELSLGNLGKKDNKKNSGYLDLITAISQVYDKRRFEANCLGSSGIKNQFTSEKLSLMQRSLTRGSLSGFKRVQAMQK